MNASLRGSIVFLVVASASCVTRAPIPSSGIPSPAGDALAEVMVRAQGGQLAFQRLRNVSWHWAIELGAVRREIVRVEWDPARGRAHVISGDLEAALVLDTRRGWARQKGTPVPEGPALDKALEEAHAQWVNASYWLAAPLKVLDPGARRSVLPDGRLLVSFGDRVGLTPGDTYAYTLDARGLPARWDVNLAAGLRMSFVLAEPEVHSGVVFHRVRQMGAVRMVFDNLHASRSPLPVLEALDTSR